MTLFIISFPLMALGLAIATVPIIVAMIGEQKERNRGQAGAATTIRTAPARSAAVPGTGPAHREKLAVTAGPDARFADEPAA